MFGPLVGEPGVLSPDLPANILSSFKALYSSEGGAIHSSDQGMDHFFATQRCGPSLLTFSDVRQMVGPRLEDGALYQTVIAPSGLLGSASIGVVIGGCQTVLSVQAARESDLALDPDERDERARMRLLQPALVVGLETLRRLDTWRSVLVAMLDRVGAGLVVFGPDGFHEITRNERLDQMLQEELEAARLLDLVRRAARLAATALANRRDREGFVRDHDQQVALAGGTYRLLASRIAPGTLFRDPAILVLVDRVSVQLPACRDLVRAFGLTARQAEMALLVAEGLPNKAIAARLGLSAHTVRHRIEQLFDKLELHSRKALALHLLRAKSDPGHAR